MRWSVLLLMLFLAGCVANPAPTPDAPRFASYPFAPTSLRIHPLTHVESAEPGAKGNQAELVLHIELLDKFGDSVKGLGKLSIELYKPGPGASSGIETQELAWDVPGMDDPAANTRLFDLPTRTYRVQLSVPRWVADAVSRDSGPGWVKVRAVLAVPTESGDARHLEDEYVIQG